MRTDVLVQDVSGPNVWPMAELNKYQFPLAYILSPFL